MTTQCEVAFPYQCDISPLPASGAAESGTPTDSLNPCASADNERLVTIICSCGKHISVAEHEIRTAMTAILGFGEILARELTDSKYAFAAEAIRRNGRRLLQLLCGEQDQREVGV
jgi:hypothetical protein